MNHIVLPIIRRGILRWFRFWSQKNISAYAFKRNSRLKKFAWADPKNFHWFESGVKFWFEIYPYVMKLKVTTSRIADGQKIEHVRYLWNYKSDWVENKNQSRIFYADSDDDKSFVEFPFYEVLSLRVFYERFLRISTPTQSVGGSNSGCRSYFWWEIRCTKHFVKISKFYTFSE